MNNSPPSQNIIEIKELQKIYTTKRLEKIHALKDIDLTIKDGEFITVVGPSGCGKSTLLKIIAGLIPKSGGSILLNGTPVTGPRKDIGVVFQDPVLLPWRTVLENTLLPVVVQNLDKEEYTQRAVKLLEMVGLSDFTDKYPFELSGGMQQRNAIIRALVHDPAILLMDEPFGALDAMTRENMNLEIMRIWRESSKTIFFITHSITEAVFLADRVVVLSSRPGEIIDILPVPISRPRDLGIMSTLEFGEIVKKIRIRFQTIGDIE